MKSSMTYKYAFFFIYALCCMQFYKYAGIDSTYWKLACFIIQPVMFLLCYDQIMRRVKNPLYKYLQWILISTLLSFASAWLFWGQNFMLTYRVTATMFSFLFFFYLCKKRPAISFLENFVWFFGILYCVLWLYAFSQIPTLVFGTSEEGMVNEDLSRGIVRLAIDGGGFVILSLFLSVNKFYVTRKMFFLALAALFYVFIILLVTRQIIFWSVLIVAGYIYLRNKKLSIVIVIIVVVFFAVGNTIKIKEDSIIGSLLSLTERQVEDNEKDEDIRIKAYKYFFISYSKNIVTTLIGNGMPHSDSKYGKYLENLHDYDRLYLTDVGYAMMYVVQGVFGLVFYVLLFYKSALTKVPDELSYARMFMIYFIPANIAASWYAKADYQLCMSICVYILITYGKTPKTRMGKILYRA